MFQSALRIVALPAAAALVLLWGGAAQAQPARNAAPAGPASFASHDRNGDGHVSREEFDATRAERRSAAAQAGRPMRGAASSPSFEQLDADGDGRLSPEEFAAPRARGGRGGMGPGAGMGAGGSAGRNAPAFASFDADGDGFITEAEFDAARSQRIGQRAQQGYPMRNLKDVPFADVDTNRDGRIDSAEFAKHQAANRRAPAGSPTR